MQQIALDLREVELLFVLPDTEVKEAAQHVTFLKSVHFIREEIRVAVREFSLWKSRLQAIGRAKSKNYLNQISLSWIIYVLVFV